MMIEQFGQYLASSGYQKIMTKKPNIGVFYRLEGEMGYAVLWAEFPDLVEWTPAERTGLIMAVRQFLAGKGIYQVNLLTLLVTGDLSGARAFTESDNRCWLINPYARELILYENQCSDMDGLRGKVEEFLSQNPRKQRKPLDVKNLPWVSLGLVVINALVFLVCTFTGNLLYNKGAFSLENILTDGEWYRIFTALFLHVDLNHLFSNMLLLYFAGEIAERHLGHGKFACLYLAAGLGGNLLSMAYEWFTGFYSSVGASGAVFGILGMLLALVLLNHGRLEQITLRRIVLMIGLSVYSGASSTEINNMAHVGGLLTGFLLTLMVESLLKGKERAVQKR